MAGQHWGERDGKSSPVENALIGIFSTIATFGFYAGLVLAAAALLRGETGTVVGVSDGDTIQASCARRRPHDQGQQLRRARGRAAVWTGGENGDNCAAGIARSTGDVD
jgi:hypothetical protein